LSSGPRTATHINFGVFQIVMWLEYRRWTEAFDMYQLEFFYSSEWISDTERKKLAKRIAIQYGLRGAEENLTSSQVEAVPSFP
jgi:hypothetical protein